MSTTSFTVRFRESVSVYASGFSVYLLKADLTVCKVSRWDFEKLILMITSSILRKKSILDTAILREEKCTTCEVIQRCVAKFTICIGPAWEQWPKTSEAGLISMVNPSPEIRVARDTKKSIVTD